MTEQKKSESKLPDLIDRYDIFEVTVFPSAKKRRLKYLGDNKLELHIKEAPKNNMANKSMIASLAEAFCVSVAALKILTGHKSRKKRVQIKKMLK